MNTLNDTPVWLITGCSRGLGRALAERVLARRHRLIATAGLATDFTPDGEAEVSR